MEPPRELHNYVNPYVVKNYYNNREQIRLQMMKVNHPDVDDKYLKSLIYMNLMAKKMFHEDKIKHKMIANRRTLLKKHFHDPETIERYRLSTIEDILNL